MFAVSARARRCASSTAAGLFVNVTGTGVVSIQSPEAGSPIEPGIRSVLRLQRAVVVPDAPPPVDVR